jgi:glycosyltransferase involved in cell wall biosynthesis
VHVLVVDGYFHWPPRGGGIRDIAEVANGLSADHEVTFLVPGYGFRGWFGYRKGLDFAVQTVPFDGVSFNGPTVLRRFRKAIGKINPDVVIVANGNAMKPFMILASRGYRTLVRLYSYELLCPVSHGVLFNRNGVCESNYLGDRYGCIPCWARHSRRGSYDRETVRSLALMPSTYARYLRESLSVPEAFILSSKYMRRRYSQIIDPDRTVIIPSGLDCRRFAPNGSAEGGPIRIFGAGRLSDPTKGLGTLMEAGERLWDSREDFRIQVAGHSQTQEGRGFVESLGWISERKLPAAYARSDIVVVPSVWAEPFGMVALEGMGCGKPVVASRTGGLQDFVTPGRNGYLFDPGHVDDLTDLLAGLMESPRKRRRLGRAARLTALRYDWTRIVPEYDNLLESSLTEGRDAREG